MSINFYYDLNLIVQLSTRRVASDVLRAGFIKETSVTEVRVVFANEIRGKYHTRNTYCIFVGSDLWGILTYRQGGVIHIEKLVADTEKLQVLQKVLFDVLDTTTVCDDSGVHGKAGGLLTYFGHEKIDNNIKGEVENVN